MDINTKKLYFLLFLISISLPCISQEWRERMDSLNYSPKYFGPNAFPIPEIISAKISHEYQMEARYDYHHANGDNTQDVYLRGYIPFGTKAGLEISGVVREYYNTSEACKDYRLACNTKPAEGACYGDVIANAMFQVLESEKWFDALLIAGLKTASGNMLVDARYTDAASYWFNINCGRNLIHSQNNDSYLRLVGMFGFYCYMTNSLVHRQDDAWLAGGGIQSRLKNIYLDADLRGFHGYKDNGDEPLLFHTKLKYRYKNHSIYFRYQYGLHDYLYQTFSGGYIFSFKL